MRRESTRIGIRASLTKGAEMPGKKEQGEWGISNPKLWRSAVRSSRSLFRDKLHFLGDRVMASFPEIYGKKTITPLALEGPLFP
jgi:hypothetical protein